MKERLFNIFLIIIVVNITACKQNSKENFAKKIVTEWNEKKILFPNDASCCILGKDTLASVCNELFQSEYKLLLYVDSSGCSDCRLKLLLWKQLITEADSLLAGKLSFLFFFQPKNKKEIASIFKRDKFDYPVFIDTNNSIERLNHFPQNQAYQCFLLDNDNKVVLIGNPTLNPKIWELYKTQITGKEQSDCAALTTVAVDKQEQVLSDLTVGKTSVTVFNIKNTGDNLLLISRVDASCGCTVPQWEKQPIESGKETEIRIEITPTETGIFRKTVQVHGNIEQSPLKLIVSGKVNNK